jgi:hypothetical protein
LCYFMRGTNQWLTLACCGLLKGSDIGCPAKQPTTAPPAKQLSRPPVQIVYRTHYRGKLKGSQQIS